jgi:hypothetical protein
VQDVCVSCRWQRVRCVVLARCSSLPSPTISAGFRGARRDAYCTRMWPRYAPGSSRWMPARWKRRGSGGCATGSRSSRPTALPAGISPRSRRGVPPKLNAVSAWCCCCARVLPRLDSASGKNSRTLSRLKEQQRRPRCVSPIASKPRFGQRCPESERRVCGRCVGYLAHALNLELSIRVRRIHEI